MRIQCTMKGGGDEYSIAEDKLSAAGENRRLHLCFDHNVIVMEWNLEQESASSNISGHIWALFLYQKSKNEK